jgi:SAM-dependent methyltransferase
MSDPSRRRWDERHRDDGGPGEPSPFVVRALATLAAETRRPPEPRRALDVACGRGRHALLLAERGYRVDAVDFSLVAVRQLTEAATTRRLAVHGLVTDVTAWPIPRRRYALVVVVSFLERALIPALCDAVAPGGALLYETFVRDERGDAPVRADFALAPGELESHCDRWRVLLRHDETTVHHGKPARRAGLLAERPLASASSTSAH